MFLHDETTPMTEMNHASVPRNQQAFRDLMEHPLLIPGDVTVELCCGIGVQTEVLLDLGHNVVGGDLSLRCVQATQERVGDRGEDRVRLYVWDLHKIVEELRWEPGDGPGFVYDFNTTTFLRKNLLPDILERMPRWVVFTDIGMSKVHLNYRSYGLTKEQSRPKEYARSHYNALWEGWLKERGWRMLWVNSIRGITYYAAVR